MLSNHGLKRASEINLGPSGIRKVFPISFLRFVFTCCVPVIF